MRQRMLRLPRGPTWPFFVQANCFRCQLQPHATQSGPRSGAGKWRPFVPRAGGHFKSRVPMAIYSAWPHGLIGQAIGPVTRSRVMVSRWRPTASLPEAPVYSTYEQVGFPVVFQYFQFHHRNGAVPIGAAEATAGNYWFCLQCPSIGHCQAFLADDDCISPVWRRKYSD